MRMTRGATVCAVLIAGFTAGNAGAAFKPTSHGQISVTQVMAMLDNAPKQQAARQVLSAYLTGLGETAGIMIDASSSAACERKMALNPYLVRRALMKAVPNPASWQNTAATPLIIRDMMDRAACKLGQ